MTEDEKMTILNEEGIILKSPVKITFGKTSDTEPFEFMILSWRVNCLCANR
jgi:hypothetical protein